MTFNYAAVARISICNNFPIIPDDIDESHEIVNNCPHMRCTGCDAEKLRSNVYVLQHQGASYTIPSTSSSISAIISNRCRALLHATD